MTCYAELLAKRTDCMGYTTYVFKNLNTSEYIMCTRFPNWEHPCLSIKDKGFLDVKYVEAGIDKWFNGKEFIPYKYTNIIFEKFIIEKPQINLQEITID